MLNYNSLDSTLYEEYVENPYQLKNIGIDLDAFNYNLKDEAQSSNWVHQYAFECLVKYKDETCHNIKLAAVRHIVDIERSKHSEFKYTFNAKAAQKAINFFKLLCHVKASDSAFLLLPWQQFIVGSIFGWVHKEKHGERFLRRFRQANVFVARKNGKSTLACGIALYMLLVDGEVGADVYTTGPTGKQARIVFDDSRKMLKASVLSKAFSLRMNNDAIHCDALNAKMEYKNSIAENLDGMNSHCVILDEIHSFSSADVYNVMKTSLGGRINPLFFVISTAGFNLGAIGHQLYMAGEERLRGIVPPADCNDLFDCLYTIDTGDAFDSIKTWHKANPSLRSGARSLTDIESTCNEAKYRVSARPNFFTKILNFFSAGDDKWLDWPLIQRSAVVGKIDDFNGTDTPCYLGVDIGLTSDLSAIGYVFILPDGTKRCFSTAYFPRDGLDDLTPNQAQDYIRWSNTKDGSFVLTEGSTCDFDYLEDEIKAACRMYNVQSVELDPWNSTQLFNNLKKAKVPAVQRGQGLKDLNEPTKLFEKSILDGDLKHDGSGVLMWCMANACLRITNNDCVTVEKDSKDSEYKIDCLKALIIALAGYVHQEVKQESKWKKGRTRIVSI